MKEILTAFALIITSFASAQIVNIPDPDFKNYLLNYSPAIDINHDGEIQVSEALAISNLNISGSYMDITGIKAFDNLDTLDVQVDHMLNLDVSNMAHLRKLSVDWASNSFNISGCNNLEYLNLSYYYENIIADMTISLPRLKIIDCHATHVGNMVLTGCDSLRKISLNGQLQEIQKLDISGLTHIDSLLDIYSIHRLIARNCTGLKVIQRGIFGGDIIDELDVTGCINLNKLALLEIYFPTLDLSSCINLKIFNITGIAGYLQNLNIKNGRQLDSLFLNNGITPTTPLNVCADDFEIDSVSHMIARYYPVLPLAYQRPFFVNSYCSFFPGGSYNTIKGKLRLDLNNNGCDNADAGMPNVRVKLSEAAGQYNIATTDATGDYSAFTNKGIFSVQPYFPYPYFTVNPTNTTVTFDTANNLLNTSNFCIRPNGVHNDLEITFLPMGFARPGFYTHYRLVYKNKGTTTLSGNVQVNFDNNKMNFTYASTNVTSQTAGQLTWNYNNLLPFESKTITVGFTLLPPPVNNINDTLIYLATVNPTAGDETPDDNNFILPQRVIGSYDPNDKQCLEGSKIALADIDKYLHYIIHFQNLGNDTAFNIVVADTLSNKLDWNSVELISSSHICDVKQTNGKLEFFFSDIKLPYKAINDEGSNGFVAFKVKPKNTVTIGDSLNNRAGIYFDFNPPVITNMATTIVSLVSPIPVKLEYFSGSKKNEINVLTWKAPSTNGSTNFSIERSSDGIHFTSIGNFDATTERCQLPFNFTDNNPLPGKNYYRLKITDVDRIVFYSKILLLENNKTGIDILSVISTKENTTVYFNSDKQQTIQMHVIAADGRLIYNNSTMISGGNNNVDLKLNKMATGIYTLIIYTNNGEIITRRFIK